MLIFPVDDILSVATTLSCALGLSPFDKGETISERTRDVQSSQQGQRDFLQVQIFQRVPELFLEKIPNYTFSIIEREKNKKFVP